VNALLAALVRTLEFACLTAWLGLYLLFLDGLLDPSHVLPAADRFAGVS
jgi:hypothetical protein